MPQNPIPEDIKKICKEMNKLLKPYSVENRKKSIIRCIEKPHIVLIISNCEISDESPEKVCSDNPYIESVKELNISECELNNSMIQFICLFNHVEKLSINGVKYNNETFPKFDNFKKAKDVHLKNIEITRLPDFVTANEQIESLTVKSTKIETIDDFVIKRLKKLSVSSSAITQLLEIDEPAGRLETLELMNLAIETLPEYYYSPNLTDLTISNTNITDLTPISKLEKLEKLNISSLEISEIPRIFNVSKLKELDISNTKIKELPQWILNADGLTKLNLSNCHFETFNENFIKVAIDRKLKYIKNTENKESKYILLDGTTIQDMDIKYLLSTESEFLKAFIEDTDRKKAHEAQLVFLGDDSELKQKIIRIITHREGAYLDEVFTDGIGVNFMKEQALSSMEGRQLLPYDTHISFFELNNEDIYRPAQHLLINDNSLFVVVLNTDSPDSVYQKAVFWSSFVEIYTSEYIPNPKMFFILVGSNESHIGMETSQLTYLGNTKISMDKFELMMDSLEETDENIEQFDNLLSSLSAAIRKLPSYNNKIPSIWKKATQQIEQILEVTGCITNFHFDKILNSFGISNPTVRKALLNWMDESGYIFKETIDKKADSLLYFPVFAVKGIFTALHLAEENNGKITVDMLYDRLGETNDMSYSKQNSKDIVKMMISSGLCFEINNDRDKDKIIFPLEQHLSSLNCNKNHKYETLKKAICDEELWKNPYKYTHYIIKCKLLTRELMSALTCEIITLYKTEAEKQEFVYYAACEGIGFTVNKMTVFVGGIYRMKGEVHIFCKSGKQSNFLKDVTGCVAKIVEAFKKACKKLQANIAEEVFIELNQEEMVISLNDIKGYKEASWDKMLNTKRNCTIDIDKLEHYLL